MTTRDDHYCPEPCDDDQAAAEAPARYEPTPEDWADYERHLAEMEALEGPAPF